MKESSPNDRIRSLESDMQQVTAQQIVANQKEREEKFIALIKRQEILAAENPEGYKRRVVALAWLGYGYILFVLLMTVLTFVGMIWLMMNAHVGAGGAKLLLLLGLVFVGIVRSLWVRLQPPEGVALDPKNAPKLIEEVKRISDKLDAIKIDRILINDEANAAAIQIPRFGVFGPSRNYLLIGVPLLLSLSPDEFRFVVAHEFGHFSGQHGKFGCWVYRLNRTWEMLQINLQSHASSKIIFGQFFNWFEPVFAATTFVLRRANEYEADKIGAELAGRDAACAALLRIQYVGPHIQEKFWEPLFSRSTKENSPPENIMTDLAHFARGSIETEFIRKRLEEALKEKTDYGDTHPCLTDRLRAMGISSENVDSRYSATLSEPLTDTAAHAFCGEGMSAILESVNREVLSGIKDIWTKTHRQYQAQKAEFDRLDALRAEKPLSAPELLTFARLTEVVRSPEESLPLYASFLELEPDSAEGWFSYGDALLDSGDEAGILHLRKAIDLNPQLGVAAIDRIGKFENSRGNARALDVLRDEMLLAMSTDEIVDREARTLTLGDRFIPHGLSAKEIESLTAQFAARTDVIKVFVIRKVLPSRPSTPKLTIIVERKKKFLESETANSNFVTKVVKEINSAEELIMFSPKKPKPWVKLLSEIPGALIVDLGKKK